MEISEIMTSRVVSVQMDDSLTVVKEIFDNTRFHHLLVVHSNRLVGVVSDRDLLKAISPFLGTPAEINRDTRTLHRKVHQIMTRELVTLDKSATVKDAISVFNSAQISCIPITEDDGVPIGILSWRDIFRNWA